MNERDMYEYKIKQLKKMLEIEEKQPESGKYGANLRHWCSECMVINLDEGAIKCLIEYYGGKI